MYTQLPAWTFVMQPICESRSLRIHHHELLLRNLEDLSLHGSVLQEAESNGFIPLVDFYALSSAVESLEEDPLLRLSVNISSVTVNSLADDFLSRIPREQDITSRLTIELTETHLPDLGKAMAFREELENRGISFSIDDFGPGHVLTYAQIMALRPDEIKLSGEALVRALNGDCTHIVEAVSAGCRVVAECIDTPEKLDFVRKQNIALVQGYIIHHR